MGGGGGGGDTETTIRYAPYVEDYHKSFLADSQSEGNQIIDDSPYTGYQTVDILNGFFGAGYTIASFPSLYDMYGKFMAGLDVENLWEQSYGGTVRSEEVNRLAGIQAQFLQDELEENQLPAFQTGMRDINSVMSSSYVIGKSLLFDGVGKNIERYVSELQYKLIPIAAERWLRHLEWNKSVINSYMQVMQLYYSTESAIGTQNIEMIVKNKLWPFTVLDYERANIGALQGATTTKGVAGESGAGQAIGGAIGGAALGAQVAGPWGAVAGGVLGLASAFF